MVKYIENITLTLHRLKDEHRMEYNLSVVNMRTQQGSVEQIFFKNYFNIFMLIEVDQMRQRGKFNQRRLIFPTSIITASNTRANINRQIKEQGRPIASVFLTQDPVRVSYSIYLFVIRIFRMNLIIQHQFIVKQDVMLILNVQ